MRPGQSGGATLEAPHLMGTRALPHSWLASAGRGPRGPVLHIDHPLGVGIAEIAAVRRPVVDLREKGRLLLPTPPPPRAPPRNPTCCLTMVSSIG